MPHYFRKLQLELTVSLSRPGIGSQVVAEQERIPLVAPCVFADMEVGTDWSAVNSPKVCLAPFRRCVGFPRWRPVTVDFRAMNEPRGYNTRQDFGDRLQHLDCHLNVDNRLRRKTLYRCRADVINPERRRTERAPECFGNCLLYTSDAADERSSVD